MNTLLWVLQGFIAFTFLYSGIHKSIFSEPILVARGQTGVEGLPLGLIRFIGLSEIAGAVGIILPGWLNVLPLLTVVAALCFALIMVLAARIHYRRREFTSVLLNTMLFFICLFIAYGRLFLLEA